MKNFPDLQIAVAGASGAVGQVMLELLLERGVPARSISALASPRSAGDIVSAGGQDFALAALDEFDFAGTDLALFSAGAEVARRHAPRAVAAGCVVIDNSSAFRTDLDIPLVVPEVNGGVLDRWRPPGIIANPNCSTIQMVMALQPLAAAAGLERVHAMTWQSVSGKGRLALEELARQTAARLNFQAIESKVFPQPIAFNVLPQVDDFEADGSTREEWKMIREARRLLCLPDLALTATAVRVPVFYGHAVALHLRTVEALPLERAAALLAALPGVRFAAEPAAYPTPLTHAAGHDEVHVGRLRRDPCDPQGLCLWVVADNIRKGAALNAVQIAERLVRR